MTAEQVFAFKAVLCDNAIDRDFERFSLKALQDLQKRFLGKTVIQDHNWKSGNQVARIYATELQQSDKVLDCGEPYTQLVARCYMIRTPGNADLIAEIKGGIKREGSVGVSGCAHDWSDTGLSELAMYENDHTREVLDDFAAYGCTGYALYNGDDIAAFCIGEVMGDTLIVHIEKAKREYKGAFQMINCMFAKTELEKCGVQFINREDDVGDEGLRQAKQSYFPAYMLKKFRLSYE